MTLSKDEEINLAELFETPGYKVLKKVYEAMIVECSINALNSRDLIYTAEQRGHKMAYEKLHKFAKANHAKVYNLENK